MDPTQLAELLVALQADNRGPERAGTLLCTACIDLLAVDSAGIMLVDGGGRPSAFAVSDPVCGGLEELQFTLGEGPGIDAHTSSRVVSEADLERPAVERWSAFGPAAVEREYAAMVAIPLRVGEIGLGALDLYLRARGPLLAVRMADAEVLAQVITDTLLSLQEGAMRGGTAVDIDVSGGLRAEVHQATGMISEQLEIPIGDALARLRAHAYAAGRPISEVAHDVTSRRLHIDGGQTSTE